MVRSPTGPECNLKSLAQLLEEGGQRGLASVSFFEELESGLALNLAGGQALSFRRRVAWKEGYWKCLDSLRVSRMFVFALHRLSMRSTANIPTYLRCMAERIRAIRPVVAYRFQSSHRRESMTVFACLGLNIPTIRCKSRYLVRIVSRSLLRLLLPRVLAGEEKRR